MSASPPLPEAIETIPAMLAFWAAQIPDAPVFIAPGRPVITYAALWREARALAEALNHAALGRDDRVVLLLPDGPPLAVALLGAATAAIAMPLSHSLTAAELAAALQGFQAAAAIVSPSLPATLRDVLAQCGTPLFTWDNDGPGAAPRSGHPVRAPRRWAWPRGEDIAIVGHTSGTTGAPKRVPHTHRHVTANGRLHRDRFGLSHRDRTVAVAPMSVSLGRTALLHSVVAGASLVFPPAVDLPTVWATIECEHPTWLHTPAGFLDLLARHLRAHPPRQPSSLRFVRVTAAAISPEICDELERLLGVAVLPSYSSSEAGAIAATLPPPAPYKRGSTGRLVQEARIVDDAGRDVGPREAGEIWVRSPKLFAGYLDDPGMNAAAFQPDGWFRTGDVGYLDEDGFLFLTGRRNELINRGGAKISPAEVDAALLAHPAVRAAATFGVPDERLGEDIVAAVVLEDSAAVPSRILRAWLLDRLAPFKTPRRIWFVADLPRTASGKPQRRLLAERFLAAHAPPAAE